MQEPLHGEARTVALVTGGSGLIGGEIIIDLARGGHRVRAVVRGSSAADARRRLQGRLAKSPRYRLGLEPFIDVVMGDTGEPLFGMSPRDLEDVGVVIHCAANTKFSDDRDEAVWRTNVGGAQRLVEVAAAVPRRARILFISTTSVVTSPSGMCVTEDAPFDGYVNSYTLSKREAEAIVCASGADVCVVRPSIVLSKGLRDRALARSILWAVPIMAEIGDVPVEQHSRIDMVPVDHVSRCIVALSQRPSLRHSIYNVSAGSMAQSFDQMSAAVIARNPHLSKLRAIGSRTRPPRRTNLLKPLEGYLPFINANICYSFDRLVGEIGELAIPLPATEYVPELVSYITTREAHSEMARP